MENLEIQKIWYYRFPKKPTLKQFLVRKMIKEIGKELKGKVGTTMSAGRYMPKTASIIKDKMKGLNADKIKEIHPEWVEEYEQEK